MTDALLVYAEAHFALSKKNERGKTKLQEFIDIREQTGVVAKELLNLPELPEHVEHIWSWFLDMSADRDYSDMGSPKPISWADRYGYFQLHKIEPFPWELRTLQAIDRAYLRSRASPHTSVAASARGLAGVTRGE